MIGRLRRERVLRDSFPFGAALVVVALAFALGGHHLLRHRGESLRDGPSFACIQPNIPQIANSPDFDAMETKALGQEVDLTQKAIAARPQLLVWPEAILSEGVFNDEPLNSAVHAIVQSYDGWFMLGSQDFEYKAHQLYNAAYLFAPGGLSFQEYRKTRLVLLGEYVPLGPGFSWLRKDIGADQIDFSPGTRPVRFAMTKPDVTFAPLICFEDTLSDVVAKAARLRPDFFVTITNDGWYTGWCATWGVRQHLALALFRCVEQDRPMLRCANNGVSCVIDQNGVVTDRLRDASGRYVDVGGIFAGTLRFYPAQPTLYQAWGNWIVLISSGAGVMLGVWWVIKTWGKRAL
jgi:apolipoprotein N-acyltransferase